MSNSLPLRHTQTILFTRLQPPQALQPYLGGTQHIGINLIRLFTILSRYLVYSRKEIEKEKCNRARKIHINM